MEGLLGCHLMGILWRIPSIWTLSTRVPGPISGYHIPDIWGYGVPEYTSDMEVLEDLRSEVAIPWYGMNDGSMDTRVSYLIYMYHLTLHHLRSDIPGRPHGMAWDNNTTVGSGVALYPYPRYWYMPVPLVPGITSCGGWRSYTPRVAIP